MIANFQELDLKALVDSIRQIHEQCVIQAGKAVNVSLTMRNWAIGGYIREYEQHGADRAQYSANLLETLSDKLSKAGLESMAARSLRLYRQFYLTYPQIWQTLSAKSSFGILVDRIWQSLSAKTDLFMQPAITGTEPPTLIIPPERLLHSLSFSHFAELVAIDDPLQRLFYEIECIRGNWSVRELKRQVGSLYYERSGLSKDKARLAEMASLSAERAEPRFTIRDPYVFEFLGIKPREVMSESDLEEALLDRLQDFLLELGHGFCFEARQKRIMLLSNMRWREWTTISSYPSTNLNFLRKKIYNVSWKSRSGRLLNSLISLIKPFDKAPNNLLLRSRKMYNFK